MIAIAIAIDILSWILLLVGSYFFVVGAVGLVRLPDVYSRMHGASVKETLGSGLLIAGMMLQAGFGQVSGKLFILGALFFLTAPVAAHALGQAALHMGLKPQLDDEGDLARAPSAAPDNAPEH